MIFTKHCQSAMNAFGIRRASAGNDCIQKNAFKTALLKTTGTVALKHLCIATCAGIMGSSALAAESADKDLQQATATAAANGNILHTAHPNLSNGALRYARLKDLPDGIILRAETLEIKESDLAEEFAQAPAQMQNQLKDNSFFILEQKATGDLLNILARRKTPDPSIEESQLLQRYFSEVTAKVEVSDQEVKDFYDANRNMVGDAPLTQLQERIREFLRQEKQQKLIEQHIRKLGREIKIELSAPWTAQQAKKMLDNPLDLARASGTPTFASFGADTCIPCQQMKPIREKIQAKYGERLNMVYVHVNQDQMLASRFGVRGIPHTIFFDAAGKEIHAQSGVMTQAQIEEWIAKSGVQ